MFKVKALHIRDRLVDTGDGGRVTDSSFGAILGPQVSTVDAPDTHLT